ncbi:BMP family protein [Clostridia bacterium]|nr:BMP family protein [Clostridia bacterium]
MKKVFAVLLVVMMLASVVGCAGGDEGAVRVTEPEDLKMATLLPSSPTDGGWGQTGANAINAAKEYFGCEAVIVEAGTADLMKSEAVSLAEEGFNIIIGHGGQYAAPFAEISADYPNTYFFTAGGDIVTENQMPVEFMVEELTYIMGAMAANISETGVVGLTVGGEYPSYTKTSRGFELGAKATDPDIEILYAATQDSSDMNEAYEIAMAQIDAGADIIWTNANQSSLGSIQAAKERGVYVFGMVQDQKAEAPDLVIASVVQDFNGFAIAIGERYLNDSLNGETIKIRAGVDDESLYWAWNDAVKDTLPEDVVGLYDELLPKIQSGEIYVPSETEGW